jgi:hypothetical protein
MIAVAIVVNFTFFGPCRISRNSGGERFWGMASTGGICERASRAGTGSDSVPS